MVRINIKRGLDIPIKGKPGGEINHPALQGKTVSLNLSPFKHTQFKLMVKIGDRVKEGQPLAYNKARPGSCFVSPAAGAVVKIRRGLKRRLLDIIIEVDEKGGAINFPPIDPLAVSREKLIARFKEAGLFALLKSRPFGLPVNPDLVPKAIFVKAVESAPFTPPAEMQVAGYFEEFQIGLNALSRLANGACHLVYHEQSTCRAFTDAQNVNQHTISGPHPIGTHSLHIQNIRPIESYEDIVWTANAADAVAIGHVLKRGRVYLNRVISIAGTAIDPDKRGYFQVRQGVAIRDLAKQRVQEPARMISGDPLMGVKVTDEDYLSFDSFVFCAIPESSKRKFLYFIGLGLNKFSASRTYFSSLFNNRDKEYEFTTSLHGERRAFIEPSLYDKVMPLNIPTMQLVKAVMANDFDLAEKLGLLEIDREDFALPTFVCPSKINMVRIIGDGLAKHAEEVAEK